MSNAPAGEVRLKLERNWGVIPIKIIKLIMREKIAEWQFRVLRYKKRSNKRHIISN